MVSIRECTGCEIELAEDVAAVKLMLEGCERCTLKLNGKVLTETCEIWRCDDCTLHIGSRLATVQVDACTGVSMRFGAASHFDRLLTCGAHRFALSFDDAPHLDGIVDLEALRAQQPEKNFDDATDQFITRIIEQNLLTELIVRLANDFPTTEREAAEYAQRTRVQGDKLDEMVGSMLGTSLGKEMTDAERQQLQQMMREQTEASHAAAAQSEQSGAARQAARVQHKRAAGNEAFKAGEFQQAAVAYTQALALEPTDPELLAALRCNRSAAFLKIGRYDQALLDCDLCIELNPSYAKAHFRRALALQAGERFGEACSAFNKCLALEPTNKDAKAGLRMAEVQAERQRRAAA